MELYKSTLFDLIEWDCVSSKAIRKLLKESVLPQSLEHKAMARILTRAEVPQTYVESSEVCAQFTEVNFRLLATVQLGC